jgi:hypothetical protein
MIADHERQARAEAHRFLGKHSLAGESCNSHAVVLQSICDAATSALVSRMEAKEECAGLVRECEDCLRGRGER